MQNTFDILPNLAHTYPQQKHTQSFYTGKRTDKRTYNNFIFFKKLFVYFKNFSVIRMYFFYKMKMF